MDSTQKPGVEGTTTGTVQTSRNLKIYLFKDGYSLIRFLRDKEAKAGGFIPAVAVTSYVCPEMFSTAIDAGFQNIILKHEWI
jgi:DNA-binding NarL/FixJ family response regulator